MRAIDADELLEHVWRERLDSRERIANLVVNMPTLDTMNLVKNEMNKIVSNYYKHQMLKSVPSAQPERKKGCKIVKSTGHYGYYVCDQCGKPVHPEDKFCSNCGADFREDADVET